MLYNISNVINKHNHTIITAVLVTVGCVFGYGIETLLVVGGFWFGREHSQAEYRYMKLKVSIEVSWVSLMDLKKKLGIKIVS